MTTPDWITAYAALWCARLGITETPVIRVVTLIDDDPNALGMFTYPNTIQLRSDSIDSPFWRCTIVHELLHMVFAEHDNFLHPLSLGKPHRYKSNMVCSVAEDVMECVIEGLCISLYTAFHAIDHPDEPLDHEQLRTLP